MHRKRAVEGPGAATLDARGVFRRLGPEDRDQIRAHLLRLEPDDRLLRFGGHVSDAHIEAYGDGLDWSRTIALGYDVDGELRGLGELTSLADGSAEAEVALSVESRFQNQGVGSELLRRLVVIARNRSIRTLHMICLLENGKLRRMVRKLGAVLTFDHGQVAGRLPLRRPNHLTLFLELLNEAGSVLAVLCRPPGSNTESAEAPLA